MSSYDALIAKAVQAWNASVVDRAKAREQAGGHGGRPSLAQVLRGGYHVSGGQRSLVHRPDRTMPQATSLVQGGPCGGDSDGCYQWQRHQGGARSGLGGAHDGAKRQAARKGTPKGALAPGHWVRHFSVIVLGPGAADRPGGLTRHIHGTDTQHGQSRVTLIALIAALSRRRARGAVPRRAPTSCARGKILAEPGR